MKDHIIILGTLHIVWNAIGVMVALIIFAVVTGSGLLSGDVEAIAITASIATFIAFVLILFSAPGIVGGIGLLKRKKWARYLVLVLGILELINIPFGTALGIYTMWVLLKEEAERYFETG
jgi:hypothetical protein